MTRSWDDWFAEKAAGREADGLVRRLVPHGPDETVLDLAGNDYLGLSRHPQVRAAAAEAATLWGAGAGASRLVTGTLSLHDDLERELAAFLDWPAALVTSTGYHANLAVVTALVDRTSLIVSDAHIHASLIDAARLSRAKVVVTPHNDVAAVRAALGGAGDRRVLVLAESVYSVLGDAAPLVELSEACAATGALLVVDEAHGLGLRGEVGDGLVAEVGLAGHRSVAVTATLSKALGAQGGAVLGSPTLIEHLVNTARPFIFDTGLAPSPAAGALAALRVLREQPWLPSVVHRRIAELGRALGVTDLPAGAVLSVPMPSPRVALAAQSACLDGGLRVGCFRPPSVPDGISRLRITVNAGLTDTDWAHAVDVLTRVVKEHS